MKIGELAQLAQCSVETIRYYEREGLLPAPARTGGNFRAYTAAHAERLRFIRNCRALDMSQEEIRRLLSLTDHPSEDCKGVNEVFDAHIEHVEARIRELEQLRQALGELRQRCQREQSVGSCGILHGLAAMEQPPAGEKHTHL